MTEFELGYTPGNLKRLRQENGLTQVEVAAITGLSHRQNVGRWEAPLGNKDHATMPHDKWVQLLNHLSNQKENID